jgi:Ni,Fe-hydrogenase I cytochrome b subunit
VGEGSSFLNLLLEFVENFHDHSDVVDEIRQYLFLLKKEDVRVVYNRLDGRLK